MSAESMWGFGLLRRIKARSCKWKKDLAGIVLFAGRIPCICSSFGSSAGIRGGASHRKLARISAERKLAGDKPTSAKAVGQGR